MKKPHQHFLQVCVLNFSKFHPLYLICGLSLSFCILILIVGCTSASIPQPTPSMQATTTAGPVEMVGLQASPEPDIHFSPITDPEQLGQFKTSTYTDTKDMFSLPVPADWLVIQNHDIATFAAKQEEPAVHVDIVNTGYELDFDSFTRFFENREKDKASEFDNYVETSRQQVASPNSILLIKQCFQQDCRKILVTLYKQQAQAIFMYDCLLDQDLYVRYLEFFKTFSDSIQINPDKVANLSVYSFDQAQVYSNGKFSILAPSYWSVRQSKGENISVDTVTSPDEQSIIQTIVYDDGNTMSRNIAGTLVLTLLSENYTKGIIVETDGLLENGQEKITWRSNVADYRGITLFETRASAMYVVTVIWGNDPDHYYQDMLEKVINTYKVVTAGS
jgi:hypothetical protein